MTHAKWLLAATLSATLCLGCAGPNKQADEIEPGETKIKIDQAPPAAQATIRRELQGAQLEDIAQKTRDGQTIYETDIIRDGRKWEVIVAADGKILSKVAEGSAEEKKLDEADGKSDFQDTFPIDKSTLKPTGDNPYITMRPGRVLKLKNAGGETLTVSILNQTETVDGVTVGILEEKETKAGQLAEISRNFMATDPKTNDVYYFGEDVDNYKDGKVVNHDSAWRSGVKGARFGLMVPASPTKGQKFYQEIAPKVAMDRVEVVSTDETVKVPAGTFQHCLHLKETTPMEPDVSHKYFAPNIGIIKDDDFELAEKP